MPKPLPPEVAALLAELGLPVHALTVEEVGVRQTTITNVTALKDGNVYTGTSQTSRPVYKVCVAASGEAICSLI